MQQFSLWTQHLMQIAEETYQVIAPLLGTQESRKKYQQGAGGDITTEIDKCAEDSILNELSKLGEPCIIISEESGETRLFCEDLDSTDIPYLIIDPVDGTTNAMRGIPFSCISLAYADGPNISDLKSGIIVNLFTHDLYVAEKDQGAWRNQDRIYCSLTTTLDEAVVGIDVNMKNAASDIHTLWEDVIQTGYKMRLLGSCALELCMVAQGSLDLYIDFRSIRSDCRYGSSLSYCTGSRRRDHG